MGEDTRFEKDVYPGVEYCYSVQASGNYGLHGESSLSSCGSATTVSPRDILIEPLKNSLSLQWSPTEGAVNYKVYRDEEEISIIDSTRFLDSDLELEKNIIIRYLH